MAEIDKINKKMKEDKRIEKLLGKKGAEKYRQRENEKYKTELNNASFKTIFWIIVWYIWFFYYIFILNFFLINI